MNKTLHIVLAILLLSSFTATAQIVRGGKTKSTTKTEQTTKNNGGRGEKKPPKDNGSGTAGQEVVRGLNQLNLTDPAMAWSFNSNVFHINFYVQFASGKVGVAPEQRAIVERVASYMKQNPEAVCVIKGCSSPEGSQEQAVLLAGNRAASVRDMLVNKYGIKSNRIQAINMGVSTILDELSWNRAAICEIYNKSKTMKDRPQPYAGRMYYFVQFDKNTTNVKSDQEIFLTRLTMYMTSHPAATCTIYGYANSAEGAHLTNDRANSIKNLLVNKYDISSSRIITQGCGVSDMFDKPSLNSYAICEINVK